MKKIKTKTCQSCGNSMVPRVEDVPYASLPEIILEGVTVWYCTACDNRAVQIPAMLSLNLELAKVVIQQGRRLAPSEAKFLRHYITMEVEELAETMGVTVEDVVRWESERSQTKEQDEHLRRLAARIAEVGDKYLNNRPPPQPDEVEEKPRRLSLAENGWRAVA